jgi:uncharacterized protein YndB with AHSA1/START domain
VTGDRPAGEGPAAESRGAGVVELETRIAASPETVFAFFVDPERYGRWKGLGAELDPRPGGVYRVAMPGRSTMAGRYLEVEVLRRLVFTWGWEGHPEVPPGSSTVEVTFVPGGDGTIVRLRHLGLPSAGMRTLHASGWSRYLDRLRVAVAGGDPGPDDGG